MSDPGYGFQIRGQRQRHVSRCKNWEACKKCKSRWHVDNIVDGLCPECRTELGVTPDYDTRLTDGFSVMRGYDDD